MRLHDVLLRWILREMLIQVPSMTKLFFTSAVAERGIPSLPPPSYTKSSALRWDDPFRLVQRHVKAA